jgi:alpha-L-fucosidase 2
MLSSFKGFACAALAASVFFAGASAALGQDKALWFSEPAKKWDDAQPVGNGRLGAMVFGGIAQERIQFNEDTLWTGQPHDYARPTAASHLKEIRDLIASGDTGKATTVARAEFLSNPVRQKAYQPFGDLNFQFEGVDGATNYRRELNLETAIDRITFSAGGTTYTRETFASYPDQVIVVRLTASQPGKLTFTLQMTSPHKLSQTKALGADTLSLTGQVQDPVAQKAGEPGLGEKFESRVRLINEGGTASATDEGFSVKNANAVTLLLSAATSFKNFQDISGDPGRRVEAILAKVKDKPYDQLLKAHEADYQAIFNRVKLDLGTTAAAELPTDRRIAATRGGLAKDPALAALYFQFGRYMLISSSRGDSEPANLQGRWNELLSPPWESKYTTNINLEMNYWPAEVANMTETTEPLWHLIDDLVISGQRTAKEHYGCRGWVLNHNTDLWRGTAPINNIDGIWPTGAAWLCTHMWEHYLFTGDKEFLAKHAYPAMKQASLFFMDFLVKDPKTGWLISTPSFSPEQGGLCAGPSMDHQLIRALMDETLESARILNIDADFAKQLADVREQVAPDQIGKEGQLQEWLEDVDKPNNNHRHMSPLWCMYPGAEVTPQEPKLFAAAKVLLQWRGDGSTGWSYAWRIPLWARARDGEMAFHQLDQLLAKRTEPNMFDLCGPFQIDGNLGAPAGMVEMLLQSHIPAKPATETPGGVMPTFNIDLLPALPKAWPTGSVSGLRARGGFEVDIAWESGKLTRATIRSLLGNPCRVRSGDEAVDLPTRKGAQYVFDAQLHPVQ